MSDTEIKFTAHVFSNGDITLEEKWPHQDLRQELCQQILRTRDKAVRQALIALGWTPPPQSGVRQRKDFEAWVQGRSVCKKYGAQLHKNADGSYKDYRINDRWVAWKAAQAALGKAEDKQ